MKNASILSVYLVLSVILGASAGLLLVMFMPCEWVGSNFEGACGYAAFAIATGISVVIAALLFSLFAFRILRAPAATTCHEKSIRGPLLWIWSIAFFLKLVLAASSIAEGNSLFMFIISGPVLVMFIWTSMTIAQHTKKNPAISLLSIVPYIGVFIVAVLLFKDDFVKSASI